MSIPWDHVCRDHLDLRIFLYSLKTSPRVPFASLFVFLDRCSAEMGRRNLWLLYVTIMRAGCNHSIVSCWAGSSEPERGQGKGDLAWEGFPCKFSVIYSVQ